MFLELHAYSVGLFQESCIRQQVILERERVREGGRAGEREGESEGGRD